MDVRRMLTVLAIPCAMITAERAIGQDRTIFGPQDPAQTRIVPSATTEPNIHRAPIVPELERAPPISMLEAWDLGEDAQLGIGKFKVLQLPRQRSHMERERAPMNMERETRGIAGAGLTIRFGG